MFGEKKVVFLVTLIFSVTLLIPPVAGSVPPVAAFTYTPTAPILHQTVVFNASASYDPDGGDISYTWNFDDGTTVITIPEPFTYHNYTTFGTYNVTLTVTDDEAKTDTTWQSVTVREYPVAAFTYTPERPIVGETVTFNASSSNPKGGTIVNFEWDFGDGNGVNVTTQTTTHIYTAEGNFNVTLTVTDSEDLTDTASKPMTVIDYPVAAFIHSPDRPLVNETVTFDASSSTADGGTIVSYDWDFGDGTNGTGKIMTHKYAAIGNYTVTLAVKDDENLTDTDSTIVQVRKLPFATFTYSPAAPLVNQMVTFNASLSTPDGGTIVSYEWNFGDGSLPVTEADPITNHIYATFGNHTVTLTITDSEDLTDTFTDTVRILVHPVADFTYSPTQPIVNETITFNASASYDPDRRIVNYTWNFDDGSPIFTAPNPITTHNYTDEGTYNVTLTVTDDDGLTGTVSKLVTVYTFLYIHDVAIVNVTTSATEVYPGRIVNITVVAKNEGTAFETFSVTVYYDDLSVDTPKTVGLLPGEEATLEFSWNTTDVTPAIYDVTAKASVVSGETLPDQADNAKSISVAVKGLGDVNGSGKVTWEDLGALGLAYGATPASPNWNAEADFDASGKVTWEDLGTLGLNYGRTYY